MKSVLLTANWSNKTINFNPKEFTTFFDELYALDLYTMEDLEFELEEITHYALEGAPSHHPVSDIRNKIKLIRLILISLKASVEFE